MGDFQQLIENGAVRRLKSVRAGDLNQLSRFRKAIDSW